jgi:hypothetical protein
MIDPTAMAIHRPGHQIEVVFDARRTRRIVAVAAVADLVHRRHRHDQGEPATRGEDCSDDP